MTDKRPLHQDEPLEGDIGPAAPGGPGTATTGLGASYDFGSPKERRAALRRYEAEREERRRRVDAASGRIASMLVAALLAFMTFDSGRTAVQAHARGDDWLFPPGVLAAVCGIAFVVVIARVLRRGPMQVK
ncbi:hypothetical protein [Actinomadura sediminis]|uniref:DUF1206 domain-containing protein n=1 Tax=Actinomadura sediminis TaxID=1038904 RepID=A0ABW3ER79_9ACTN